MQKVLLNNDARARYSRACAGSAVGFTLVELLVVISIIGLLVALLLPSLSESRNYARTARCLAQMKQIGTGVRIYMDQNRTWMPVGGWSGAGTRSYTWARVVAIEADVHYLTEQNIPSSGAFASQWVSQTVNRDRMKNNGMFQCPSDTSRNFWGSNHSTSYGWNAGYTTTGVHTTLGVGDRYNANGDSPDERMRRIREQEVRLPSNTFALGEQMPRAAYMEENQTQLAGNFPMSTYHMGSSNMLWVDLRATTIKQEDVSIDRFKRAP